MAAFKHTPNVKEEKSKPKVEFFADTKPQFRLKPMVNHIEAMPMFKDEEHKNSKSNTR